MNTPYKRLYRSRSDKMVSGLCAGLGDYIGLDPTIVRLLFALGAIFLFPMPIFVYFVMMLVVPEEPTAGEMLRTESMRVEESRPETSGPEI